MSKYYIAYGSNLNIPQMRRRCSEAKIVGTGEIKNYELLFKGSKTGSYLTIEPKAGATVPVAIWKVTDGDETNLDLYEGYPRFYYKKEMRIRCKYLRSGLTKTINAFVYIMHEERQLGIPTPSYVRTCIKGYREFNFDEEYIYEAIYKSINAIEKGAELYERLFQ